MQMRFILTSSANATWTRYVMRQLTPMDWTRHVLLAEHDKSTQVPAGDRSLGSTDYKVNPSIHSAPIRYKFCKH